MDVTGIRALQRWVVVWLLAYSGAVYAQTGLLDRDQVAPGVFAVLRNGNTIFLECAPPPGTQAQSFLEQYLHDRSTWKRYSDKGAVAIAYDNLSPDAKRASLLALFPLDYVDATGWWHTVRFGGGRVETESMNALAEWLTGTSATVRQILTHEANKTVKLPLKKGDRVLIPQPLLLPVMKAHKAPPPPPSPIVPASEQDRRETSDREAQKTHSEDSTSGVAVPFMNGNTDGLLEYHEDKHGRHAIYKLMKGESLFSAVVVRFTDYREHSDILAACETIAKRSGIKNVHRIQPGQRILIPLEMLSDRYQPAGSEQRQSYEAVRAEMRRVEQDRIQTKDLEGVVVILDPGHGGRDRGAAIERLALYEDEINYDIVCRIKALLEHETKAKVHVTLLDPRQGYTPTNASRFTHDMDERLNTTPPYPNQDAKVSANLRWYLANDIYRKERAQGVDDRKILFASIHCDALFNETLRGAMVYVPGAQYRSDPTLSKTGVYGRFEEVKRSPEIRTTMEQRKTDEALSRVFASTLLQAMRTNDPPLKVHDAGDPIRHVIRQSGGRAYLPAVLRYNVVPTKVLVEVANMTNPQDQERLADPKWRQWFAEAFVEALRHHYNR